MPTPLGKGNSNKVKLLSFLYYVITFLCALTGFIIGISLIFYLANIDFTNTRIFQLGKHLNAAIESKLDSMTSVSKCTNITLETNETEIFEGTVVISYNCDEADNQCYTPFCSNETGRCSKLIVEGAECYQNEDCGRGGSCNLLNCQCEQLPNTTVGCIQNSDCLNVTDRGPAECSIVFCNAQGQCEEDTNVGASCWYNGQCLLGEICNPFTCQCIPTPIIPCRTDNDCPIITDRGGCAGYFCTIANVCQEFISGLGECWFSDQCGEGQKCNTTSCGCVDQDVCFEDDDCLDVSDRAGNCSANFCEGGRCKEMTINGTCWYDGQCDLNEVCDTSNCTCVSRPTVLCQVNSDCTDISDRGDCVENICDAGKCIERVVPPGTCWFSGQCGSGVSDVCNQATCMCDTIVIPPCDLDTQCPIISDRGNCVEYQCTANNTCNETILGLGECWFSDQCGIGRSCNLDTCGCESDVNTCLSGYIIQSLPVPTIGGLSLTCGLDITIYENTIVELCLLNSPPTDSYYLLSYAKQSTGEWLFIDSTSTSTMINGLPSERSARIELYDRILVFTGRVSSGTQPQPVNLEIFELNSFNSFITLQNSMIGASNTTGACVDIWNTTIVVLSGDAFILDQNGPSSWNVTQTISDPNNGSFFDCSIWETSLVLSLRDPITSMVSSISYQNIGGVWMEIGNYTNTVFSGEWNVITIENSLPATDFEFTVVATPFQQNLAITEISSSGGFQLNAPSLITTTGPGIISHFDKSWMLSSIMFVNSITTGQSFQNFFDPNIVTSNDIWLEEGGGNLGQPVFSVSPMGIYSNSSTYANFCP